MRKNFGTWRRRTCMGRISEEFFPGKKMDAPMCTQNLLKRCDQSLIYYLQCVIHMANMCDTAFRLEVKFLQENAQFQICLDPVLWYDVYLRINPRLDEVARIAREYVTTTRTQTLPEEDRPFVVEYDEIEKDKAFIPCNKNMSHNKSQYGEYFVSHVSSEMQDAYKLQFCGSRVYPSYSLSHTLVEMVQIR
ncbi:hypothetical protein C1646_676963 [Rhizophagus diaphanus]|nr:hypothetical protein C1646_676963 [Rhizophagus diaphanus] [Rhizophagus sp. MUCL 43196]